MVQTGQQDGTHFLANLRQRLRESGQHEEAVDSAQHLEDDDDVVGHDVAH